MARFTLLDGAVWTRPKRTNDCTVRAIALACDLTYDEADKLLTRRGRRLNKGFHVINAFYRGRKMVKINGVEVVEYLGFGYAERPTLESFLDRHRTGRYIVSTRRHAMVVIDGAVHDLWPPHEKRSKLVRVIVLKAPRRRLKKGQLELPLAA